MSYEMQEAAHRELWVLSKLHDATMSSWCSTGRCTLPYSLLVARNFVDGYAGDDRDQLMSSQRSGGTVRRGD